MYLERQVFRMAKKKSTFWSDFKTFITRGNVVDLAVGVVIGAAFGSIVTGLVNYIINPCVSLLTKGTSLDGIKTVLVEGVEASEAVLDESGAVVTPAVEAVSEVAILWGTWLQTIIDFLLVAFCIFVVLRVFMKGKNKLEAKKLAEAAAAAEKAAAEKAAAEKVAAEAAAKQAAKQDAVEESLLRQEKLLAQIVECMQNK
jgi:large conductance mechanosensitive channel